MLNILENAGSGAGEMVQWLKALAAFVEDPGLIPSCDLEWFITPVPGFLMPGSIFHIYKQSGKQKPKTRRHLKLTSSFHINVYSLWTHTHIQPHSTTHTHIH